MRVLVTLVFLGIYGLSLIKPYSPYIDYAINYQKISTELCENISKPELSCHGKCYLKKEVKKVSKSEDSPRQSNVIGHLFIDENITTVQFDLPVRISESKSLPITPEPFLLNGFQGKLLDPPRV